MQVPALGLAFSRRQDMLCPGSQAWNFMGLPELPCACFFLTCRLGMMTAGCCSHLATNHCLSHFASSIKLSHCHFCTCYFLGTFSCRLWESAFMCMSWLKSSPQASCTDLRRLLWVRGFSCLPMEASQSGAEEVLSCSRTHSCFVTLCAALQWEVCASGQG